MKKILNWLLDKWLGGFITASFFFLLKLYVDLPPEKKVNFFQFSWLSSILTSEIKVWKVLIIITFLILMFFRKKINKESAISKRNTPVNPTYRSDLFGQNNAKWAWDYEFDSSTDKFTVINVVPLCPTCDSAMELDTFTYRSAVCPKCRLEGNRYNFEVKQFLIDVTKEIVRRYNSGEWKKVN